MDDQTIPGSAPLKANDGGGQEQAGGPAKAGREEPVLAEGGGGSVEPPVGSKAGREKKIETVQEV